MTERPSLPELDGLDEDEAIETPAWRRWVLASVAVALVVLLVAGPVSNLFEQSQPQVADNGLEVCPFDYCTVQAAVRAAGYGPTMYRLDATVLDPEEAQSLANDLAAAIGEPPVMVEVVSDLPGSLAGRYGVTSRSIQVVEPIRAWVIVHEVAHTRAGGHDDAFVEVLIRIVRAIEARG